MCMADLRIQQQTDAQVTLITSGTGGRIQIAANPNRLALLIQPASAFNLKLGTAATDPTIASWDPAVSDQGYFLLHARDVGQLVTFGMWIVLVNGTGTIATVTELIMSQSLAKALQAL